MPLSKEILDHIEAVKKGKPKSGAEAANELLNSENNGIGKFIIRKNEKGLLYLSTNSTNGALHSQITQNPIDGNYFYNSEKGPVPLETILPNSAALLRAPANPTPATPEEKFNSDLKQFKNAPHKTRDEVHNNLKNAPIGSYEINHVTDGIVHSNHPGDWESAQMISYKTKWGNREEIRDAKILTDAKGNVVGIQDGAIGSNLSVKDFFEKRISPNNSNQLNAAPQTASTSSSPREDTSTPRSSGNSGATSQSSTPRDQKSQPDLEEPIFHKIPSGLSQRPSDLFAQYARNTQNELKDKPQIQRGKEELQKMGLVVSDLTGIEAHTKLKEAAPGQYIIRASTDSKSGFAIQYKTINGEMVRKDITQKDGSYWIDDMLLKEFIRLLQSIQPQARQSQQDHGNVGTHYESLYKPSAPPISTPERESNISSIPVDPELIAARLKRKLEDGGWEISNLTREQSEAKLKEAGDGHYVIRPSSEKGIFALDLNTAGKITRSKISYENGTFWLGTTTREKDQPLENFSDYTSALKHSPQASATSSTAPSRSSIHGCDPKPAAQVTEKAAKVTLSKELKDALKQNAPQKSMLGELRERLKGSKPDQPTQESPNKKPGR